MYKLIVLARVLLTLRAAFVLGTVVYPFLKSFIPLLAYVAFGYSLARGMWLTNRSLVHFAIDVYFEFKESPPKNVQAVPAILPAIIVLGSLAGHLWAFSQFEWAFQATAGHAVLSVWTGLRAFTTLRSMTLAISLLESDPIGRQALSFNT